MKNNFKSKDLLRIFLGLVFLSAGIYRIFNRSQAVLELSRLNLNSTYLPIFVIALEIIGGVCLILNIKTKKILLGFVIFIMLALASAFISNGGNIISGLSELFIFSPNPTNVFLHFTYLILLVYLLTKK